MSIKLKIIAISAFSCLILLGAFMANILFQEKIVSAKIDEELNALMLSNTKSVVQNVGSQLEALNDVLQAEVKNGLKVSWEILNRKGGVALNEQDTVEWSAANQYTKLTSKIRIPKFMIGNEWLGQNGSLSKASPVVDEVRHLVGGTTTIFQRINERGDMLRVCTNVEKLDNTRAIGTFIPAINPDGSQNPVIESLLAGQAFNGRAYVVNAWYLTTYEPIYDNNKQIIGALYFGIMQEKTEALRKGITNSVLGKSGYIYVLDREGNYIISKGGKRNGENLWNAKDSEGNYYIQSIIKKALSLKSGEVAYERYKMAEQGESGEKSKVAALTYFQPWDWIVGAGAYEDDFKETKVQVQNSIDKMVTWGGIIGAVVAVMVLLLAVFVSNKITNPIIQLTHAAEEISQGNLERIIDIKTKDETGQLAAAFKRMQASLVKLMQRAQKQQK
jgi:methyl-accepting chemotaxis protein